MISLLYTMQNYPQKDFTLAFSIKIIKVSTLKQEEHLGNQKMKMALFKYNLHQVMVISQFH